MPDLEDELDLQPLDLQPVEQPSMMSRAYHMAVDPSTDAPSRFGQSVSDYLTAPVKDESPAWAMAKGAVGGGIKGVGDLVSGLTSPANIAMTVGSMGSNVALESGLPTVARGLSLLGKTAAIPGAVHGAGQIFDPNTDLSEKAFGVAELAGSGAAMMHTPSAKPKSTALSVVEKGKIPEVVSESEDIGKPHSDNARWNTVEKVTRISEGRDPETGQWPDNPTPAQQAVRAADERLRIHNFENDPRNRMDYGEPGGTPEMTPEQSAAHDAETVRLKAIREKAINASMTELEKNRVPNNIVSPHEDLDLRPVAEPKSMPLGTKVTFKAGKVNPDIIKEAIRKGFTYSDMNDDGGLVFVKTKESGAPPILESDVGHGRNRPSKTPDKASLLMDATNIPRTLMASMDLSAPFRQGLGLIHKPAFWKAMPTMMDSFGSEAVYQAAQDEIRSRPLFKSRVGPNGSTLPSFAEEMGLKLSDLNGMTNREESIMSTMAEKLPGVRQSNRAYTIFLNKLRADTFQDLVDKGKVFGADGTKNLALGKELASFVNTATGRGNLGIAENAGKFLSTFMFSPRLMAARLQMLNPKLYVTGNPMVRKEALKSLMAMAAAGNTVLQLGKMAGGTVENNPGSSDYGKLKIGNTRIDPFGGFQQYIVAAKRLLPNFDMNITPNPTDTGVVPVDLATGMTGTPPGQMKSTTTGIGYDLSNPRYGQSNRADIAMRFARGKTNPVINFAWGLMAGKKELSGKPMDMTTLNPFDNAIAQRFIPMVIQDMYDLYNDQTTPVPVKALAGAGSIFGMGVQNYGDGN